MKFTSLQWEEGAQNAATSLLITSPDEGLTKDCVGIKLVVKSVWEFRVYMD